MRQIFEMFGIKSLPKGKSSPVSNQELALASSPEEYFPANSEIHLKHDLQESFGPLRMRVGDVIAIRTEVKKGVGADFLAFYLDEAGNIVFIKNGASKLKAV